MNEQSWMMMCVVMAQDKKVWWIVLALWTTQRSGPTMQAAKHQIWYTFIMVYMLIL